MRQNSPIAEKLTNAFNGKRGDGQVKTVTAMKRALRKKKVFIS